MGRGHISFGADPVGVGGGIILSCLHNVNQWLDFYLIFIDILLGHNKEVIRFL